MLIDKFHKETAYLHSLITQNRKEQLVRVYDKNKQEITYHTIGVSYHNGFFSLFFNEDEEIVFEVLQKRWLSEALHELRLYLEGQDQQIIVRGADRDVVANAMLADCSQGKSVMKLLNPTLQSHEDYLESYYILDDSKLEFVTTIEDQNCYVELWYAGQTTSYFRPTMKTIWKFELKMEAEQQLLMPVQSKILSVGVIKNAGYLWAEVSGDIAYRQTVKILTVPTGAEFPQNAEFIGTLFYNDGEVVQHIFRGNDTSFNS
jgi:hypothetical protein